MTYIYPERESKSVEFKSQIPPFNNLIKTCVAFANGIGGKLVIGVKDQTCEIVGINDEIRDRIYDEFPNSLYDATSPSLLVEIYEKRFDDLSVIIIEVPPSIKKPVFIKKDGIPAGVYLRAGSNTRKANLEYIEELVRENKRIHFDEESIHADIEVLSNELLEKLYKKIDKKILIADKIISQASINSTRYYPTVTGILTCCNAPDLFIHECVIRCTRFHGTEGRDIIQSEEIRGCLEEQIETSFQLIKSWLTREYKLLGTQLKGKMIIPEVALREAIVNALIHRKYTVMGATKIALYDDRLEIFNPGNFPGIVNVDQLGDGTTCLRNPNLARIARRLGIVEKLGTGIKLILESCNKAGIKKPDFIEGADSVKVIFYFLPAENNTLTDEEKLLRLFDFQKEIRVSDIEKYLHVSRNTVTRKLNELIKKGKIKRLGQRGPSVKYILI